MQATQVVAEINNMAEMDFNDTDHRRLLELNINVVDKTFRPPLESTLYSNPILLQRTSSHIPCSA